MPDEEPGLEDLVRAVADNSAQGVVILDSGGYGVYCNASWREMTGFDPADLRRARLHDLVHHHTPDGRPLPVEECTVSRAIGRLEPVRHHVDMFFRKDGSSFEVSASATPIVRGGAVAFTIIEMRDISAERRAEARLRHSEQLFRATFEQAAVGMAHLSPDGYFTRVNSKLCAMLGYDADALCRKHFLDVTHPEDIGLGMSDYRMVLEGEIDDFTIEKRYVRADGRPFWAKLTCSFVRDDAGAPAYTVAVMQDISLRKHNEEILQQADRRKDEFLAMLGHELRNPLAPIRATADLLRYGRNDDATIARATDVIARQVGHMSALIDDLLDVSRVTRGLVEIERRIVNVKLVIADAVEQARPLIESRGHALDIFQDERPLAVVGDHKRLVQIVVNLLNNAAKFTPNGGHIALTLESVGNAVVIRVRDDGAGIAPPFLPKVFELFTQAERAIDRSHGGLGLGLALVRNLVHLHGGSVSAHSDGIGRGSEFVVTLPRCDHVQGASQR